MLTREEHLLEVQKAQRREFEARVDDLRALQQVWGDQVIEIISAARGQKVEAEWRAIAREHGRNDIEGLKETLWKWVAAAGFEYAVTATPEGTQFCVTKCPLAEMARAAGVPEWGYICYCADDPHIVAGFNAAIGFRRTKTLMEGHDSCDHLYYMKGKPKQGRA